MSLRKHQLDPLFGSPRHASQNAIDRLVAEDEGPDSVPRRTSQPPPQKAITKGREMRTGNEYEEET